MKLSLAQCDEIRRRYELGEKGTTLAAEFGVSTTTIHNYTRGLVHIVEGKSPPIPERRLPISQKGVPVGHRRLASGKVIRYYPPPPLK